MDFLQCGVWIQITGRMIFYVLWGLFYNLCCCLHVTYSLPNMQGSELDHPNCKHNNQDIYFLSIRILWHPIAEPKVVGTINRNSLIRSLGMRGTNTVSHLSCILSYQGHGTYYILGTILEFKLSSYLGQAIWICVRFGRFSVLSYIQEHSVALSLYLMYT